MSARPQAKDKPAAASFQWDDPFLLDEQLTEDERMMPYQASRWRQVFQAMVATRSPSLIPSRSSRCETFSARL